MNHERIISKNNKESKSKKKLISAIWLIYVKLIKLWEICPRNDDKKSEEESISNEKRIYSDDIIEKKAKKKRFESYTLKPINKKGI